MLVAPGATKLLHDVVSEVWPKGLLSLVIPASQFVWHRWQDKRPQQKRKGLRQKIKELDDYLSATPVGSVEYEDAASERETARKELLALVIHAADRPGQNRQDIRDSATAVADFLKQDEGATDPALRRNAEETLKQLRAQLAQPGDKRGKADAQETAPRPLLPLWRRALLFYSPATVWGWVTHSLFFMALALAAGLAIDTLTGDDDAGDALLGWIILTVLFRGLAATSGARHAPAAPTRRGIRSWLLLFMPRGVSAWIAHILFFTTATITLIGVPSALSDGETDTWYAVPVFIALLAVLRLIAVRLDAAAVAEELLTTHE